MAEHVKVVDEQQLFNVFVSFIDGSRETFVNCSDYGYDADCKMFEIELGGYRTFIPREAVRYIRAYDIEEEKQIEKNCNTCANELTCQFHRMGLACRDYRFWEAKDNE